MSNLNHLAVSLFAVLPLAVLGAMGAGWWVYGAYRRRLRELMRQGKSPSEGRPVGGGGEVVPTPDDLEDVGPSAAWIANRQAMMRLGGVLTLLSLLVGLSQSGLMLRFVYAADRGFDPLQWLLLGLLYAWPLVLGWGLVLRWSWGRVVALALGYLLIAIALMALASAGGQSGIGLLAVAGVSGLLPMLLISLVGASGRVRASAPYFLPALLLLFQSSSLGLDGLSTATSLPVGTWPWWAALPVHFLRAWGTLLLFVLLPWLIMALPLRGLGRWLAAAYRSKGYSDLLYLFGGYWLLVLGLAALIATASVGLAGLSPLLAWLWIPLGLAWASGRLRPAGAAPTLLVLRVFRRDEAVEELFDRVIERWRYSGNSLLIAGSDLASRTLDPDDLFSFLSGRLAERFVARPEDVPAHMAALDLAPDPDGRYRVNECRCFNTTWQPMLAALVQGADRVLMDLRGFSEENKGCLHELGVLARAGHLRCLVLLYDSPAPPAVALAALGTGGARARWLPAPRLDGVLAERILKALLRD